MAGEVCTPIYLERRQDSDHFSAVAFGYFETMFNNRDPIRLQEELIRFKTLNCYLNEVGHQEHLYEIFSDATEEIFAQTAQAIQNGDRDETFLVNAFNEEYSSNAVITHFRVCLSQQ